MRRDQLLGRILKLILHLSVERIASRQKIPRHKQSKTYGTQEIQQTHTQPPKESSVSRWIYRARAGESDTKRNKTHLQTERVWLLRQCPPRRHVPGTCSEREDTHDTRIWPMHQHAPCSYQRLEISEHVHYTDENFWNTEIQKKEEAECIKRERIGVYKDMKADPLPEL